MSTEFRTLTADQQAAVRQVIDQTHNTHVRQTLVLPDGSEVYAYPHTGGTAWGVNNGENGFNIARGIWQEGN